MLSFRHPRNLWGRYLESYWQHSQKAARWQDNMQTKIKHATKKHNFIHFIQKSLSHTLQIPHHQTHTHTHKLMLESKRGCTITKNFGCSLLLAAITLTDLNILDIYYGWKNEKLSINEISVQARIQEMKKLARNCVYS